MLKADELVATADVAAILGQSVTTINRWAKKGRLTPAAKGPGRRGPNLFRSADVEAWRRLLTESPEVGAAS